jgi:hypothetical protein
MKSILQDERPIGKNSNYTCFYSEDIVNETEKALLVSLYFDSVGDKANRWLPKSKMLAYTHIDTRDIIDNGIKFVKNDNYGKDRTQYFISSFFTKDNGTMVRTDVKYEYAENQSDNNIMGVKGIDY